MPSHRTNLWTAVLITLLICIVGAGVGMGYLVASAKDTEKSLNDQITELQNQIKTASSALTSETDTSDWKTYSGDEFAFKYPKDYFAYDTCYDDQKKEVEDFSMPSAVVEEKSVEDNQRPCNSEYSSSLFNISRTSQDNIGLDLAINETNAPELSDITKYTKSTITVGGRTAYKYIWKEKDDLRGEYLTSVYVDNKDGDIYQINWKNSDTKGTPESEVSEQILETVSFK